MIIHIWIRCTNTQAYSLFLENKFVRLQNPALVDIFPMQA